MSDAKVVVLTGATRGLGRAMASRLMEEGHTVIGCGRSLSGIKELDSSCKSPHRFDCVDVANDSQVSAWAQSVIAQSGPPDLLLNNAATVNPNAPVWEVSADDFDSVIDVNIKGVANVLRHFVPSMVEQASGIIVNFSSGWGRSTSPEVGPYCATKVGNRGADTVTCSGTARRYGCNSAQPRDHQYGASAKLLWIRRRSLSRPRGMEPLRCPLHPRYPPRPQRAVTERHSLS